MLERLSGERDGGIEEEESQETKRGEEEQGKKEEESYRSQHRSELMDS